MASILVLGLSAVVAVPGASDPATDDDARAERILAETLELAPDAPPSPDDPFERYRLAHEHEVEAALERMAAADLSRKADEAFALTTIARENARRHSIVATAERDDAVAALEAQRKRMSDLTVRAYVTGNHGELDEFRAVLEGDTTDRAGGRAVVFEQVMRRQVELTEQAEAALDRATVALDVSLKALARAEQEAQRLGELALLLADERTRAEEVHRDAQDEVDAARAALARRPRGVMVPQEVPLIGLSRLTADDLASWFRASAYQPRVATPVEDFAAWFIAEGDAEGIRGDVAFAQAVLETGGFANNDTVAANNYSGIGHCDSCDAGWRFPSPELGVRAQIQLLKSYAIAGPEYVHELVDRRLRGPAGCCATWGELTTVWATDPDYGTKVMLIYTSMVDHALARRAAGQGFELDT